MFPVWTWAPATDANSSTVAASVSAPRTNARMVSSPEDHRFGMLNRPDTDSCRIPAVYREIQVAASVYTRAATGVPTFVSAHPVAWDEGIDESLSDARRQRE